MDKIDFLLYQLRSLSDAFKYNYMINANLGKMQLINDTIKLIEEQNTRIKELEANQGNCELISQMNNSDAKLLDFMGWCYVHGICFDWMSNSDNYQAKVNKILKEYREERVAR